MARLALPIFQKRISPVLDSCERLLIIDIHKKTESHREELFINKLALPERIRLLKELNVSVVICCGVSETLSKMLESNRIEAIAGVAGDVEDVIQAFCCEQLIDPKYCMPGYKFPSVEEME